MKKLLLIFPFFCSIQYFAQSGCEEQLIEWSKIKHLTFEDRLVNLNLIIKDAVAGKELKCLADALRRLGTLFKSNGRLDSAVNAYIRSYKIAEVVDYPLSQASSLNQLGVIYREMHNNKQAFDYFKHAFSSYKSIPDHRGMSDATFNMAEIQFESNLYEEAEKLCLESMLYMRQWKDTSTLGYNYDMLSRIALKRNEPGKARKFSETANGLFREDNDETGLLPGLIQQGRCYEALNGKNYALLCFDESHRLAMQSGFKKWIAETALILSELYDKNKQIDTSIYYLKLYAAYKDSLLNENITRATMDAATRYDTEKKEMELINQHKLTENSQLLNYALIAMVSLLLVTIIVLIRNSAQRRKIQHKESELQNANAMLQGQDEERERIARELHDRVGSMLSTVKLHFTSMEEQVGALVKIQHKSYEKAIELLDETYEEVRRISHDLDTGLLGRFGLRTAMLQLAQVIGSTNKLRVLYIDNDLAPELYKTFETDLYRITQELLSNTLKHAGAKEISIQLSRNNGNLVYSYEDDGKGFSKEELNDSKGIGFKNISARVKKMKGTWHLETSPGNGLNLIIEIPHK